MKSVEKNVEKDRKDMNEMMKHMEENIYKF
jgi:hypothetical protein